MASKLLNLVALSSLAVLVVTFGAAPSTALATGHSHVNRHFQHGAVARKKRDQSQRCKARPSTASSSSAQPTSTPAKAAPEPTTTPSSTHQASSTKAPAKTTTSKTASSTPSNSGSSATGSGKFGKKGSKICLAWGDGDDISALTTFKTDHVVGIYNWGVSKPSKADELGYEYMPMLWGGDQGRIDAFVKAMEQPGLGNIVLGFNEPNEVGQSNMDPQTAAKLWKQYIEPQREKGYMTCSPAMSSRPNGFQWMADFMKACDTCHVDYQCVHWYDTSFDKLQTYLTQYHTQLGLPILLTEFADQNFNGGAQASLGDIFGFMGATLKWIDETDWMMAACPFGVMHDLQGVNTLNLLQSSSGGPTDLGYMVINNSY